MLNLTSNGAKTTMSVKRIFCSNTLAVYESDPKIISSQVKKLQARTK